MKKKENLNINTKEFNSSYFFKDSINNNSIEQLIAKEESLTTEISSLQNDLQTLIYDNYSKFLGASNVVTNFSSHIDTLSQELDHLENNINEISFQNDQIYSNLNLNREKIKNLIGISRLLEKIEFISN